MSRPRPRLWRATKWAAACAFAAVLAVWVASTTWHFLWIGSGYGVRIGEGQVLVSSLPTVRVNDWRLQRHNRGQRWWFSWSLGRSQRARFIAVPLWALGAPPLLVALVARRKQLVAQRRRTGFCHACGYDRHGLAADSPCPECGATAPAAPSSPAPPAAA